SSLCPNLIQSCPQRARGRADKLLSSRLTHSRSRGGLVRASLWFSCIALLSAARVMAGVEAGVDPSIRPGDDFFAYANGEWLKNTGIPAGKERWNARTEIDELTRQQIAKLFDTVSAAPAGSDARKVADFRAAYVNEAGINASGLAPLKPLL